MKKDITAVDELELPSTVEGLITVRLDKLKTEDLFNLKLASIVGQVIELSAVQDIHPFAPRGDNLVNSFNRLVQLDTMTIQHIFKKKVKNTPMKDVGFTK